MWPRAWAVVLVALVLLGAAAPAQAAVDRDGAVRVATQDARIRAALERYGSLRATVNRQGGDWIVLFATGERVRAQATVDAFSGQVTAAYTGIKAEFPLARGTGSGVAERKLNALWCWIPLTLIFVFAFFDRRRPGRLLHLDLAAIALFGVSYAFFMTGRLSLSVPLSYPPLAYLLARMLVAGFRPQARSGPLTWLPLRAVIGLTLGLLVFRVLLTLVDPFVVDVGYASVAGADRIQHGLELYTRGGNHFDTYGPLAYLAYIPFELIWPFKESQAHPPAAQAAAIFWDLAAAGGLYALGRRLRDGALGWALALAWAACPFTALPLVCASNDTLVAALVVWSLVLLRSGPAAGLLTGAAAAAKFTPALLLPLFARGPARPSWRRAAIVLAAGAAVFAVTLVPLLPHGGLREFYDTTIGFQLHRYSPFSLWSRYPSLDWLQSLLKAGALALAVAVAFVPRLRQGTAQAAALAAAVLIAEQIPLEHWFYLYLVWFVPLVCVAVFSEHAAGEPPAASRRQPRRAAAPASYTARS